ncbi:barstar family protein [Streptomyces sp. SYSU K217416]
MTPQPRFQLLGETDDGYEILALCREAEGYFADPRPAARERYELLGCAPRGRLREAVAQAQQDGSAPLGLLTTLPADRHGEPTDGHPDDYWYLGDVLVLGARPCAEDSTLVDITVEGLLECWDAGHEEQAEIPRKPAPSPGFCLTARDDEPWGTCREVALVGEKQPRPEDPPLRLLGCEPRGRLLAALGSGAEFDLGGVYLGALDAKGRCIQEDWVSVYVDAWAPSALGAGLVDLTVDPDVDRPTSAARAVHELWFAGPPAEPNLWAPFDTATRTAWRAAALGNRESRRTPDAPPGGTYHLDGRYVTDLPGFYCALGEAMNGPGTYFGWCLDSLADCLCGDFGVRWPFTLVWHDAEVARRCLGVAPLTNRSMTFEEILAFFAEQKIKVVLA